MIPVGYFPEITARMWWSELVHQIAQLGGDLPAGASHAPGVLLRCLFAPLGDQRARYESDRILDAYADPDTEASRDSLVEAVVTDLVRALTDSSAAGAGVPAPNAPSAGQGPSTAAERAAGSPPIGPAARPRLAEGGAGAGTGQPAPARGHEDELHDYTCPNCLGVSPETCVLVDDFAAMTEPEAEAS